MSNGLGVRTIFQRSACMQFGKDGGKEWNEGNSKKRTWGGNFRSVWRSWVSSCVVWGLTGDFMLGIDSVSGDEDMIDMDTKGSHDRIVDRMKEGLEDRSKSGMTLRFSGWADKDAIC